MRVSERVMAALQKQEQAIGLADTAAMKMKNGNFRQAVEMYRKALEAAEMAADIAEGKPLEVPVKDAPVSSMQVNRGSF